MPFRATFDCLWCGRPYTARDEADVEGWAQLCPDCVGRAGDNGFLRYRLKAALAERAKGNRPTGADEPTGGDRPTASDSPTATVAASDPDSPPSPASRPAPANRDLSAEMLAYYEARAPEYD